MTKISRELMRFVLPFVPAFLLGTVTAEAATYYVSQSGSDSTSCAASQIIATPKRTLASSVPCLKPGDTLYIREGVWTEHINLHSPIITGTVDNYIKIAGYPGETVTLRVSTGSYGPIMSLHSSYMIFENLVLDGVNGPVGVGWSIRDSTNHHFILRNLEIKNFRNQSALFIMSNDISIVNCRLHDQISTNGLPGTRHYGIYLSQGSNILIEGNDIYNNAGGGVQIYPGPISNVIFRSNMLHDNNAWSDIPWGGVVVMVGNGPITNVRIYNNIFYNNGSSPTAGPSHGIYVSSGVTGTKIWNNTVYKNKGWGIYINRADTTDTLVQNNIVFANGMGSIGNSGSDTILDHNLTTDPRFTNSAVFNFTLQSSSAAINAGTILGEVNTDIKKTPRPQGITHDIGAYEFGSQSNLAAPAPPQGLRVH